MFKEIELLPLILELNVEVNGVTKKKLVRIFNFEWYPDETLLVTVQSLYIRDL